LSGRGAFISLTRNLLRFGSTRRAKNPVGEDANIKALLDAQTPVVTIFGKTWLLHVKEALHISEEENLEIIGDSVALSQETR